MYDPLNPKGSEGSNENEYKDKNRQDKYYYGNSQDTHNDKTVWNGDYYRYKSSEVPEHNYSPYTSSAYVEDGKPPKKGKHIFRKVVAGVMACLVISVSSIAGFTALVNNGTIKLNTNSAASAFTIVKNSSNENKNTKVTATSASAGELTKQQVAKKIVPSVVCIENYQISQGAQYTFGGFGFSDGKKGNSVSPASEGSGIICSSDGYIITNAHVVDNAASLKVVLSTGKTYQAKLIGSDSVTDLALIKIQATGLTAAEFGASGDLQVADTVMAVGNPDGLQLNSSVTVGYVSALNREITNSETGYTMKCIQTDAAINPGNSGGALVNMKGQVIGINSSKIFATGYEGLGFAIPINTAQPIISELKQYGYVKDRAILGITGQYIDSMTSRIYNIPVGFYVSSITISKISSSGIQKGDVITEIDGSAVVNQNTIATAIAAKKPGDTVKLSVTRSITGQKFTVSVQLSQATGK